MFCWVSGNRTKQDANCYYRKNDWPQWASSFLRHPNRFCLWSMWMIHPYVSGEQMCFCQKKTLIVLSSTALKFFSKFAWSFSALFKCVYKKCERKKVQQRKNHFAKKIPWWWRHYCPQWCLWSSSWIIEEWRNLELGLIFKNEGQINPIRKGDNSISFYLQDIKVLKQDLQ